MKKRVFLEKPAFPFPPFFKVLGDPTLYKVSSFKSSRLKRSQGCSELTKDLLFQSFHKQNNKVGTGTSSEGDW